MKKMQKVMMKPNVLVCVLFCFLLFVYTLFKVIVVIFWNLATMYVAIMPQSLQCIY